MGNNVSVSSTLGVGNDFYHAAIIMTPIVDSLFDLNRVADNFIEVFRTMRPGGHVLLFCSDVDEDLWGVALRAAGLEIRDTLRINHCDGESVVSSRPVILARKPLAERTVATNVLRWGTGGLNIDACRIPSGEDYRLKCESMVGLASNRNGVCYGSWRGQRGNSHHDGGRFPANVMFDSGASLTLDEQSGVSISRNGSPRSGWPGQGWGFTKTGTEYADVEGASRFFFVANDDDGWI